MKIGGSLFSAKNVPGSLDTAKVEAFSKRCADLAVRHPGKVALITGGGAFGHGAIRDRPASGRLSLAGLTHATFTVKWAWVEALARVGAEAFPLQLSAMCLAAGDGFRVQSQVLESFLGHGILPVLAGDCLLTEEGEVKAVSSDRVPEILLAAVPRPTRVVVLTDVPGILRGGHANGEVIREVDARNPESVYRELWTRGEWDSTGAMHEKFGALVACALLGAECFIMRIDPYVQDLDFLFAPLEDWPDGLPYTRIA
nr:hypothetical protein [Streptomonospora sp. PA3]